MRILVVGNGLAGTIASKTLREFNQIRAGIIKVFFLSKDIDFNLLIKFAYRLGKDRS